MARSGVQATARNAARALLALALSVGLLAWAFHDVKLSELGEQLRTTSVGVCLLYLATHLAVHGLRVVRWGLLVKPLGPISNRAIFAAASVGLPATFFLPLRLGEFVRPAMAARSGLTFTGTFASVVVERIADGLVNVGLFFTLLALLPSDVAVEVRRLSWVALVFFGGGLVALGAGYYARDVFLKVVSRLLRPLSPTLAGRVVGLLSTFLEGLRAVGSPGRLAGFAALSLVYWGVLGWATHLLAASYAPALPLLAGPFLVTVTVFAIMIPAGPAFAGTLEAGFRVGLAPFGVDAGQAAAVAIVAHILQILAMALIAGVGLLTAPPKAAPRTADTLTPEIP